MTDQTDWFPRGSWKDREDELRRILQGERDREISRLMASMIPTLV